MQDPELKDNWILGLNFFQDYFVKFEMPNEQYKQGRVGIQQSKNYGMNNHSNAIQNQKTNGIINNSQDL